MSFFFNSNNYYISFCNRLYGRNVRAVRSSQNHTYVDLGLPSGLLWATCNVGADNPEDYGDYFAWGETQPKSIYNWSTYQYCNGNYNTLTKYCNNSSYGYNGFTDNLTTLLPEDDAATANWGSDWRMPTKEEWQELYNNTTCTWTTQNGVNGCLFTASNGDTLFLPAAGYRDISSLDYAGSDGLYWSSSPLHAGSPCLAWYFLFNSGDYYMGNYSSDGYNGFTDNLTTLLPEDDAATANWGSDWRMPTKEEWQELLDNTTNTWTTQNGVNGRLFTASNGNSLFLPAAGYRGDSSLDGAGSYGGYWSSSLLTDRPCFAWYFYFDSGHCYMDDIGRNYGHSLRPVRSASQN